jgi:predicted house-cleaning noncanonical NTP pyrophosphatase (MazG superfamily)
MSSKEVRDQFSKFVEKYKIKNGYKLYSDAILDIIKENVFDFVTYSNTAKFVNDRLTKKLEQEFKEKNLLKS